MGCNREVFLIPSLVLVELNSLHPVATIRCFIKSALRFHFKVSLYILNNVIILATSLPFPKMHKYFTNSAATEYPVALPSARRGVVKK